MKVLGKSVDAACVTLRVDAAPRPGQLIASVRLALQDALVSYCVNGGEVSFSVHEVDRAVNLLRQSELPYMDVLAKELENK